MSRPDSSNRRTETDDRILSDFSTDPELAGYSHKTWALAAAFIGFVLVVLPQLFPLPIALIVGIGTLLSMGTLFSAAPPHLSPWQFAHRRITSRTRQQIYVANRSGSARSNHTTNTENEEHE